MLMLMLMLMLTCSNIHGYISLSPGSPQSERPFVFPSLLFSDFNPDQIRSPTPNMLQSGVKNTTGQILPGH